MDTENSPFSSVNASEISLEQTFARTDAREPLTEVQVRVFNSRIAALTWPQSRKQRPGLTYRILQRSIRFCDSPGDSTQKSSLRAKTPSSQVYRMLEADAESSTLEDLKAVLLWQNPAVSALAFLCGCLTCLAIDFGLNGSHGLTLCDRYV